MALRFCHWPINAIYGAPLRRQGKTGSVVPQRVRLQESFKKDLFVFTSAAHLERPARHDRKMRKLVLLFVVAVMAQAQGQACSRILTSSAGTISSPSYPLNYPPNQDCSYVISAPIGSRVTLTFVVFRTEPGLNGCDRDYIQIRDGNSATSPLMGIYCDVTVQAVVRSFSNSLYVRFVSDSSVSSTGFLATYATGAVSQRYLLMTNTVLRAIHRYDIDTGSNYLLPLAASPLNPIGVDYDPVEDRVYWTDVAERTIRSAFLNGTGVQLVRNIGPGAVPDGVAVDYLSRLLIYTDAGNRLIAMQTLSGSKYKVIINTNIERPRDIELDKRNGVMYWSDWGTIPKIERANYDGTGRKTLVSGPQYIVWPDSLALDTAAGRLYWADGYTDKIGWTTLDGASTTVIFYNPGSHFFGMDVSLGYLYISDWGIASNMATTSYLQRISTDGRSGKTIGTAIGRLNDVVTVDDSADKGPNVCTVNNGGCSSTYICIPAAFNTKKCLAQDVSVVPGPRVKRSLPTNENDAAVTVRRVARSAPGLLGEGPLVGLVGVKNLNQTGEVDNMVPSSGSSLII